MKETILVGSQTNLLTNSTDVFLDGGVTEVTNGDRDVDFSTLPTGACHQSDFVAITYNVSMVYEAVAVDKYTVTYDANGGTGTVTDATLTMTSNYRCPWCW